ncbi:DNA polymerase III subunit delta' [Halarcobacter bivalviorum]|uniref:DNA polymerase III subunit delta n=1 Tax=Halarcobacter bivalviorum TaxID=663364 RepID=A0AAX2A922_9BACT|nr:DNA polymerase III subunit delta' [Halarcobacter bivalviorum]AXH12315.1 DNA polymerase III, delta prime subunit [Halarcobacter bivalviorum]RXK10752.1 DNA polymerase III subunit delta' [Halarcobacter bivalviorum]
MMFNEKIETAHILIVNDIDEALNSLLPFYSKHNIRVIKNEEKEEFQLAQATATIKEAYISSNEKKYIFLCGKVFRKEAQNSLLKILEEPPSNIVFIIITNSKSTILPTIFSRMPHKILRKTKEKEELSLDIKKLDLKDVYEFLKTNQRIDKKESISFVESLLLKINKEKITLSQAELELFSKSIKLLNLNSRPINVLTTLLLTLINRKNKY